MHRTDRDSFRVRIARELVTLFIAELDAVILHQGGKRGADRLATIRRSWGAQDEIEILLAPRFEVPHLVVVAEPDETALQMTFEQPAVGDEIEQNPPAGDLRMTIAARVVLPDIAVPVGRAGLAQRPYEYGRSSHPGSWSDRDWDFTKKATVAVGVKNRLVPDKSEALREMRSRRWTIGIHSEPMPERRVRPYSGFGTFQTHQMETNTGIPMRTPEHMIRFDSEGWEC